MATEVVGVLTAAQYRERERWEEVFEQALLHRSIQARSASVNMGPRPELAVWQSLVESYREEGIELRHDVRSGRAILIIV